MTIQTILIIVIAAVFGVAALLAIIRMIVGPSILDRAIASDVLLTEVLCILGADAVMNHHTEMLPVMLMIAATGILGTVAVKDFDFAARMAQKYGPKIAVGVDMKDGFVAVAGWREVTPEPGLAFCRRCAAAGVQAVIATDISRDGTLQGTNLELYRALLKIPGLRVTASGGIAGLEELEELAAMGCHAAILGQSIYTGAIDLAEAVRRCQS